MTSAKLLLGTLVQFRELKPLRVMGDISSYELLIYSTKSLRAIQRDSLRN